MHVKVTTEPAREPLTLAEAKHHLRVTHTDDDTTIDRGIRAARRWAEVFTHRAFITRTVEGRQDAFGHAIELPLGKAQAVSSVKYIDSAGSETTVDSSVYTFNSHRDPAWIYPAYSQVWPTPRAEPDAVRIVWTCGYGDNPGDVPEDIRHAMLIAVADLYEHRESLVLGTIASDVEPPTAAKNLLMPFNLALP